MMTYSRYARRSYFAYPLFLWLASLGVAQAAEAPAVTGGWHCHFLHPKNQVEKDYYSVWTFNPQDQLVDVFYSPVHKGFSYGYRWRGDALALGHSSGPFDPVYGTYKTQRPAPTILVVEDPRLPWKGWQCQPKSGEDWPGDGLRFLNYAQYPWLAKLMEDGLSITQFRNPEQYQEWLKSRQH